MIVRDPENDSPCYMSVVKCHVYKSGTAKSTHRMRDRESQPPYGWKNQIKSPRVSSKARESQWMCVCFSTIYPQGTVNEVQKTWKQNIPNSEEKFI